MKNIIVSIFIFLSFNTFSQQINSIDRKIDSLQKLRNNYVLIEVPNRISKLKKVIDSLNTQIDYFSKLLENINEQKSKNEKELEDLNYQLLSASNDNVKIKITYRIPVYPRPSAMADVEWISGDSELLLLDYDESSSYIKFVKVSHKGKIGYVSSLSLIEDKAVSSTVTNFIKNKGGKISEYNINSQNSINSGSYTPSNSSVGGNHYYNTGPKGGKYYINSNGNKTYKKK